MTCELVLKERDDYTQYILRIFRNKEKNSCYLSKILYKWLNLERTPRCKCTNI